MYIVNLVATGIFLCCTDTGMDTGTRHLGKWKETHVERN